MEKWIETSDHRLNAFLKEYSDEFARLALFIIFYWFGILKLFGVSAAETLVSDLLAVTFLGFIPAPVFLIGFGIFEALLGTLLLIPKFERLTFILICFHLITTMMPLFLLPGITWDAWLVPTLTGQYILKNLALVALSFFLYARLRPMSETHSFIGEED